jgi:hypothetical protein
MRLKERSSTLHEKTAEAATPQATSSRSVRVDSVAVSARSAWLELCFPFIRPVRSSDAPTKPQKCWPRKPERLHRRS